jgi:hypothetical protein
VCIFGWRCLLFLFGRVYYFRLAVCIDVRGSCVLLLVGCVYCCWLAMCIFVGWVLFIVEDWPVYF